MPSNPNGISQTLQTKDTGEIILNEGSWLRKSNQMLNMQQRVFSEFKLTRHMRVHIGERAHTGEKPHPCNICARIFSHKYTLFQHVKVHIVEKPDTCNICIKPFIYVYQLSTHKRVQARENPTRFKICNNRFLKNSS